MSWSHLRRQGHIGFHMLHILDWLDVSEAWGYFDEDGVGPAYLFDFQGPNPSGTQFETRELEVVVLCVEQD